MTTRGRPTVYREDLFQIGDTPLSMHESFNKPLTHAAVDEIYESLPRMTEPNNPPASREKTQNCPVLAMAAMLYSYAMQTSQDISEISTVRQVKATDMLSKDAPKLTKYECVSTVSGATVSNSMKDADVADLVGSSRKEHHGLPASVLTPESMTHIGLSKTIKKRSSLYFYDFSILQANMIMPLTVLCHHTSNVYSVIPQERD